MKRNFVLLLLLSPVLGFGQVFTNLTLKQAQEKAAHEQKIILVDVMRPGGNAAQKAAEVSKIGSLPGVAEFVAEKTIAIRVDMGTDAGHEFAPLLQMNMYPTYAFLMPNGDMLKVINPGIAVETPDAFMQKANEAWQMAQQKWNNTRSIQFQKIPFEEALRLAKRDHKLIFVDAYTDNCQPCMMMVKNIFTLNEVADFYNANFINLTLNLGTEHQDLAKRYGTSGYPSYLYLDGDGNLVSMASGYCEASKFLGYGKKALETQGVYFMQGSWAEILAVAKQENKPIFMDCYTVWCGPCKQMSNVVFKERAVADYFNANFINVKVDMEKGEGIDLKDQFGVKAYPTFLYLDATGKEINRIVGSMSGDVFLTKSQEGMAGNSLTKMTAQYEQGDRQQEFVLRYLEVLDAAYEAKQAQKVAVEFFKTIDSKELLTPQYWELFDKYIEDVDSEVFQYVYANRNEFYGKFDPASVDRKFFMVWSIGARRYLVKTGDQVSVDLKGYQAYQKRMKKESVQKYATIVFDADLYYAEQQAQWAKYANLINQQIKRIGLADVDEFQLYNWILRLEKSCQDPSIRVIAAGWCKEMLPEMARREELRRAEAAKLPQGGPQMAISMINFEKEFARLQAALTK